jgi:hypothetical protein
LSQFTKIYTCKIKPAISSGGKSFINDKTKTPSNKKLKYLKYLIGLKVISRLKGLLLILNQYSAVKISSAAKNKLQRVQLEFE